MDNSKIIIVTLLSAAVTMAVLPVVRKFSIKIGNVDKPKKDARKLHSIEVPNGAGIAIYIGFLVAVLSIGGLSKGTVGLLIAGLLLVVVGVFDELYEISSTKRLFAQVIAAIIVISAGVEIDVIGNFGGGNDGLYFLKALSIPVTLIWIVVVTNAIKILDGIDGLCAGVAGIIAWTMGLVAFMTNRPESAMLGFILGASAFAYLPYNFSKDPNRKTFMAESGSTFLGFSIAVVSIMGSVKTATVFSILAPVIVLIYPLFDIIFAVGRRLACGKNPFAADGMHLHHRLLKKGLSHAQATCVFYLASIILGILAICSTKMQERNVVYMFLITILVFIVLLWKFKLITFPQKKK